MTFGRRQIPRGKDGQIMKCCQMKPSSKGGGKCSSTEHLARERPFRIRGSTTTLLVDSHKHEKTVVDHPSLMWPKQAFMIDLLKSDDEEWEPDAWWHRHAEGYAEGSPSASFR